MEFAEKVKAVKAWHQDFVPSNISEREFKDKVADTLNCLDNGISDGRIMVVETEKNIFSTVPLVEYIIGEAYLVAMGSKKIYNPFACFSDDELFDGVGSYMFRDLK